MKRIITILALAVSFVFAKETAAKDFRNETLQYVITYKWGLIHKDAGEATMSVQNQGDRYRMTLTGKTKPWADKFYQVRDTLVSVVRKEGFKPQSYTKIAHEDGKYSRDDIMYSYSGNIVGGKAVRHRVSKKGEKSSSEKMLTASGQTFDMLSVFYFLRTLDYDAMTQGKEVKASLFSGSKVELLTVRCVGKEKIKLRNKETVDAWHIKFNFTTEGKKKSSDDINAWLAADGSFVPLEVVGNLPIGQVKCYLVSK